MALRSSIDVFKGEDAEIFEKLRNKVDPSLLKEEVIKQLTGGKLNEPSWCIPSLDANAANANLTGGKGSSLAMLNAVSLCNVPRFFCVSTKAFKFALERGECGELMQSLQAASSNWVDSLNTKSKDLEEQYGKECMHLTEMMRKSILQLPIFPELEEEIRKEYSKLCSQATEDGGKEGDRLPCAVRSSATTEDTADASFAGQHDTFLFQRGVNDIITSVRKCWASIFTDRAVEYRNRNGIPHSEAVMCVVVQQMVHPYVAGTSFSVELSTTFPAIHVCASYGLGEAVVNGAVTGDEWLVDKSSRITIKRVCGSKRQEYVPAVDGEGRIVSGIQTRDVEPQRSGRMCLDDKVVKQIAEITLNVATTYNQLFGYNDVDTEFAVTHNEENDEYKVHMLQSRPVVAVSNEVLTVEPKRAEKAEVLLKGQYSLLGAVTGKLKVILDFDDLVSGREQIQADDILVTTKTSNYFNPFLSNLKGICTFEGSATAHPMLIGRERKLPVVCGIPNASMSLLKRLAQWNGINVTLCGLTRSLYAGELPTRPLTPKELVERFTLVKIEEPPKDDDTVEFLRLYHRLYIDPADQSHWVYNPNAHLSPVWSQIRLKSYDERFGLVNSCRSEPLKDDPLGQECKIVETQEGGSTVRKVVDKLVPVDQTLKLFEGMSLDDCYKFFDTFEVLQTKFIDACKEFAEEATVERWNRYIKYSTQLYACGWLSFFFRMYVNFVLSRMAQQLGVSQLHYDQMLKHLQEKTPGEDDTYQRHLKECALDMLPILQGRPPAKRPQILKKIEFMAQHFRTEKETDILRPWPLEVVLHTVLESAYQLSQSPAYSSPSTSLHLSGNIPLPESPLDVEDDANSGDSLSHSLHAADQRIEFFPSQSELLRWAQLSISSRVQMSTSHHIKVRGQNIIKGELLRVARVCRLAVWQDIFLVPSLEKMEEFISLFEKSEKGPSRFTVSDFASPIQNLHDYNSAMRSF